MKEFDVTTYDFDRFENEMTDGIHHAVDDAISVTDAVLRLIESKQEYVQGTQGYEDWKAVREITCSDDDVIAIAYRCDEHDERWEVHVFVGDVDEAFIIDYQA